MNRFDLSREEELWRTETMPAAAGRRRMKKFQDWRDSKERRWFIWCNSSWTVESCKGTYLSKMRGQKEVIVQFIHLITRLMKWPKWRKRTKGSEMKLTAWSEGYFTYFIFSLLSPWLFSGMTELQSLPGPMASMLQLSLIRSNYQLASLCHNGIFRWARWLALPILNVCSAVSESMWLLKSKSCCKFCL